MPAPGQTAIILYHSTVAGHVPSAGNLNVGELAINIVDNKGWTLDPNNNLVIRKVLGTVSVQDASAVVLTGGTINSIVIGGTTAAAGSFTTLAASGTISGAGVTALFASPPSIGSTLAGTGAFTTLSASGTVSGAGITALFASPPAIGGTAAAAGAFTTLSASGTVSGTGFTNLVTSQLASPPPIGSSAPNTGAFTTLSASGTVSGTGFSNYLASYIASPGAIGSGTPNTGRFTTVTLTSGSGLTFSDSTAQTTAAIISNTTPSSIAATASVGTATPYARADHVHDGVLSITAGTGISVNASKGAVTITNTNTSSPVKAWINFNGLTSTIRSSFNVSSVVRNGTGSYTINFTTALSDTNYSYSGFQNAVGASPFGSFLVAPTPTTSSFSFQIYSPNAGLVDGDIICFQFFR